MSYIGATGLDENQEQFDILKDEIDANASYINNLVGIPDPLHTAVFGINVLNPGLFGLVERAEVKIKLLETAEEGLGTDVTGLQTEVNGLQTEVNGIQTEVNGIQTEITGIQGQVLGIEGDISTLNGAVFLEGGAIALVEIQAADALTKANRALDIWDYSGDNVYHKKAGNVGIGNTFGSTLTNKLEVQGNINIPTGSTFRINNEPFNYSHLAGEQPVSSKWTNATDTTTNIYYNTGNVGIGITTAINNKLEVAGNLNISTGSKYKINNVDLAFSDLGGTLSYNSLTNQLSGGTNIQILNGVINNTYELPKATTNAIGGVRPDGSTITINTSTGVISSAAGTPQVNSDWTQTNTSLKSFIQNKPTAGTNISLANNTITNIITGSPTQNIITLNDNYLIVKDKPDSQIVSQVDVPLTSGNEPYISSPAFTESIRTFTHSGGTEAQTPHTITIGQNTICDILIVGGGGSGDRQIGGGGGGGAVLYATNITIPANTYTIKVGKGGSNGNGGNSEAFGAICLGGGSTPFTAWGYQGNGNSGGSGSGGSSVGNGGGVGVSTKGTLLSSGTLYNGNVGGNSLQQAQAGNVAGGGGGGAGTAGFISSQTAYTTRSSWIAAGKPSNGGDGIPINITGTTYYWGAGGGGCGFWTHAGDGGLGGGGGGGSTREPFGLAGTGGINSGSNGLNTGIENGGNGAPNTGSGGGGGSWNTGLETYNGGNGGSGIIIIKFKSIVGAGIPEGNPITHKTLNFVYVPPAITYDFTNFNTYPSWTAEATRIGATYSLNAGFTGTGDNGVYFGGNTIGFIELPLPNTHNFMTITFGNAWTDSVVRLLVNGTIKATSPVNGKTTYSQAYSPGDILRIEEILATIDGDLIIVLTNTNYITNTYTLSVQAGTSIQVNNGTAQYLSGNYTISVGATQSSVVKSGIGQVGSDPYPLQNGSTIAIRYSMLQRITSTINIKKDGLIKYVPASGTNPTTGSWNIIDLDTQPLTQFSGNLPANRLDNIDMSKVATGTLPLSRTTETLPISRITGNYEGTIPINLTSGNLPASRLDNIDMGKVATGNLYYNRVQDFHLGINNRFHRVVYTADNIVDTQGIWTNKFKIETNLHLNQYGLSYNYYQYFLSMSPNNVQDRHKYWFGTVKMSTIVGTDNPANTQYYNIISNGSTNFDIRGTSSTQGVWWLDVWVYTTAYCESLIVILH
jgi:hypothetical protein